MLTADSLRASVNLYTGEATFPLELASIPGRNGLDVRVTAVYGANVRTRAGTWNLDAPTGVLGLGWTLPLQRVTAVLNATGSRADDAFFLDGNRLLRTGTADDGAWIYQAGAFVFWKILYYPAAERWEVTHEDGDTWTYGDAGSGRGTVEWSVRWGGWIGSSARLAGQERVASGWLLGGVRNRFGDTLTYAYAQVEAAVGSPGGVAFTRATYLSSITGPGGERAVLSYDDKNPLEYAEPHTDPTPPNAWQDPLETRYLSSVRLLAADGGTLLTVNPGYAGQFLGSGSFSKRLLASVSAIYPNGRSLPSTRFTYWGQDTDDGVTRQAPFKASTGALYGSLRTVTPPEGGTVTFTYQQVKPALSARDTTVAAPVVGATTYGNPRFRFADGFVVSTWFAGGNLAVVPYAWDGRWLAGATAIVPATTQDDAQVATGPGVFAVFSGGRLYPFGADRAQAGRWVQPSVTSGNQTVSYFTPALGMGEGAVLAAGDGFAAVLGTTSGKLFRYRWNGQAWAADDVVVVAGGSSAAFTLAARDGWLLALSAPKAGAGAALSGLLAHRDTLGAWKDAAFTAQAGLPPLDTLSIAPGDAFAAFTATGTLGTARTACYGAVRWNAAMDSVTVDRWRTITGSSSDTMPSPDVQGSMVAVGTEMFRFDGVEWRAFDTATVTYAGQQGTPRLSVGADRVARVIQTTGDTPYVYDLLAYDPETGAWSTALTGAQAGGTLAALAPRGDLESGYAVWQSRVQYQAPGGSWSAGFTLPDTLTADQAAAARLLGSRWLVYEAGSGSTAKTVVYLLANGDVSNPTTPVSLTVRRVTVPGSSPDALIGRAAFVDYTGTYGDPASVLTLHAVDRYGAQGVQDACVAAVIRSDNGYAAVDGANGTQQQAFTVTIPTATMDPAGIAPRINRAVVTPGAGSAAGTFGWIETGFFNGLLPGETPSLPYPVDASAANAQSSPSLAQGLAYTVLAIPAGGSSDAPAGRDDTFWWITTRALGSLGVGAYARTRKSARTADGVTVTTDSAYADETGLLTRTTLHNWNAAGVEELLIRDLKYGWEVYDTLRTLNLLLPVVQETASTKTGAAAAQVTAIGVTTWRGDWGSGAGRWAPERSYVATSASAPAFTAWNPGDPEPASGWLRTGTVLSRTAVGLPLAGADVDGVRSTTAYDASGRWTVSACGNADVTEGAYYGFEPYETGAGWGWSGSGSLASSLTTADFHTGTRCLRLPPLASRGTPSGPARLFQPAGQHRRYVLGCWVKLGAGYSAQTGKAGWQVSFANAATGAAVGSGSTLDLSGATGQWRYAQQVIDLNAVRTAAGVGTGVVLRMTTTAHNRTTTAECLLDELRLTPLDAVFSATVYDPVSFLTTADIDNTGQVVRTVYDGFQRPVATTGPLQAQSPAAGAGRERVNGLASLSYSRQLVGDDAFHPTFPNTVLSVSGGGDSWFFDFHDASTTGWTFAGNWAVTHAALRYAGGGSTPLGGTATWSAVAYTNFAARVRVTRDAAGSVAVGNGYVYLRWNDPQTRWELVKLEKDAIAPDLIAASNLPGFREEWIFAVVDGLVLCFVDGIQIFAWESPAPSPAPANYGKLTLAMDAAGAWDDVVLMDDPRLTLAFADGLGVEMQSATLLGHTQAGDSTLVGGALYDPLGRPYVQRGPVGPSLALLAASPGSNPPSLVDGSVTTYLATTGALTIPQYLAGTGGAIGYAQTSYESSPLGRPTALAYPRPASADASRYTATMAYAGTPSVTDPSTAPGDGNPARYFVTRTTRVQSVDARNAVTRIERVQVRDMTGQVLALLEGAAGGPWDRTEYVYDAAGNVTSVKPPNYFSPPSGSAASSWAQGATFDFLGRLTSRTTPDAGTARYLYDSAGRPRFRMDAAGAVLSPQQVGYVRYDALGRPVEIGYIQDARYAWGRDGAALQAKANDPAFPDVTDSSSGEYAAGAWKKRWSYDFDATDAGALYLVGRLAATSINNGATPDGETYRYDAAGNAVTVSTTVQGFGSQAYAFATAYDNDGRVRTVTYPQVGRGDPFHVAYSYDRAGRLAAVGTTPSNVPVDPDNPPTPPEMCYASYAYDAMGRLSGQSLNNTARLTAVARSYAYDAAGWLTSITDPFLAEALDYAGGQGYNGVRYYDGRIAASTFTYAGGDAWPCPPQGYGYAYAYDTRGRLTAAQSTLGDAWSLLAGDGTAAAPFDPNGNPQAVRRGSTTTKYQYVPTGGDVPVNNQLITLAQTVADTLTFESVPAGGTFSGGWSWGASNGGPSTSAIVSGGHGGSKSLRLGGGSEGHYEVLRRITYLPAAGSVALSCWVKTADGFAAAEGTAGWFATLAGASGPTAEVSLGIVPAAADWTQLSLTLDVGALRTNLALGQAPVTVSLELRNYKRGAAGTGPSLQVDDVSLSGSRTSQPYAYNANGGVASAPEAGVFSIAYDPVLGLPTSVRMGTATGAQLAFAYGAADQRVLETLTPAGGGTPAKRLYLYGPADQPLLKLTRDADGTVTPQWYVQAPDGMLAVKDGSALRFVLRDHLGSTRLLVEGDDTTTAKGWWDYLPYGGTMRQGGSASTDYLYTGQELDASGLYNYRARLYDPTIGRFLATDPAGQYPSPYLYVGNDPVNFTDPSGEWGVRGPLRLAGRAGGTAILYTGYYAGVGIYYGIYYTGTALWAGYAAATWWPLLTTVTLNSGYGGYKAYGRNETITSGLGRGATMGVVSYYSATFGGGIYVHNLAWGVTTGTFSGGLNAYLWNEDIARGAGWGGVMGGGFATLNSGMQAARNWRDGYGFLTNEGAVRYLVGQHNAAVGGGWRAAGNRAIAFIQSRYGMADVPMTYRRTPGAFGVTYPNGNILISGSAFARPELLKLTMIHERGHSLFDRDPTSVTGWACPREAPWNYGDGVTGYSQEILHAGRLQVGPGEIAAGVNPFFGHTWPFWRKFGWSTPWQYWYLIPRRW
ncbi:MAG: RHS repeat-associated core domain-containing protein [Longimicrobiaceae bacterium]